MRSMIEHIGLLSTVTLIVAFGYVGTSQSVLLDENTIAYWSFDEGTGDEVVDASRNNNDGEIDGAVWTGGKYGKALAFDGKDDFVEVPDSDSLHAEDLTITAWINVHSDPHDWSDGGAGAIVFKNNEYQWSVDVGSGAAPGLLWFGIWGAKLVSEFDFTNHLNEWHHVAVTFDSATQECKIYVDGKLDAEGTVAEQVDPLPTPVLFGSREGSGRPDVFYHGALDDIEISNVVRDQAEIIAGMAPLSVDACGKLATTWSALRRIHFLYIITREVYYVRTFVRNSGLRRSDLVESGSEAIVYAENLIPDHYHWATHRKPISQYGPFGSLPRRYAKGTPGALSHDPPRNERYDPELGPTGF